MTEAVKKDIDYIHKVLAQVEILTHAYRIINFDLQTVSPRMAQTAQSTVLTELDEQAFLQRAEEAFGAAVDRLYAERDQLDEWDRPLIVQLFRRRLREKKVTAGQQKEFSDIRNEAWIRWNRAKEQDDFLLFRDALQRELDAEIRRVSLWETAEGERPLSVYDRMISENEYGLTTKDLDPLFAECAQRIRALMKRIGMSPVSIRTDFLYRTVSDEQQKAFADYLMELMCFDRSRGMLATSEHPFTDRIGRDDVRITTHYEPNNFLASMYSVLHEGGHGLFEQLLGGESYDHFLSGYLTMGQHESVSRFYENIIGRSAEFIRLIYPKVCEIFPQVMEDVSEEELYAAVNLVTPSLIRVDADELTYTLHILIRYELEKKLVAKELPVEKLRAAWNESYQSYLGITPKTDREGVLQDVHWADGFGYFPTYALGNFYGAMYLNRMREDFDPYEAVSLGDFARINDWMREHVFSCADRLDPRAWIQTVTGRELTAEDFLAYLEDKYEAIYPLQDEQRGNRFSCFDEYIDRMIRIRLMSSPRLYNIHTAEEYSAVLQENFRKIGQLAAQNRKVYEEVISPILTSEEELPEEEIAAIHRFNESLVDGVLIENIDLSIMSQLSYRLKKDAIKKQDKAYLIRQFDEEIIALYPLILQSMRIVTAPEISQQFVRMGAEALDQFYYYLQPEQFRQLDEESREIVMINSRYAVMIYERNQNLDSEMRWKIIKMLEGSAQMAEDPLYRKLLPNYDWSYHLFRSYQYIASLCIDLNLSGYEGEELTTIAHYARKCEELFLTDPKLFSQYDAYSTVLFTRLTAEYRAGELAKEDYQEQILAIYEKRDKTLLDSMVNSVNISVPMEYIHSLDRNNLTEKQRQLVTEMYRTMLSYVFRIQKGTTFHDLLSYSWLFVIDYFEIPGGDSFEKMVLRMLAAVHPPTYIHSNMVATISRCLVKHMIGIYPELFVGVCGCPSKEAVPEYAHRIMEFTYHAALCHDFGKLLIIDTVSIYGRKLLDFEFEVIKQHPDLGAHLLAKYPSTEAYADIARGHHRFYDNTRGYPENFDTAKSPNKTIIDIVTCADCMDAATDRVGRSYNRGKTFADFVEELREGAGTRYAPYFPELFAREEIKADMEYLLTEGRQEVYLQTFVLLKDVHESL